MSRQCSLLRRIVRFVLTVFFIRWAQWETSCPTVYVAQ